ncbi:xanthine dehydrogenase small subunit [Simiduia sp. 21SJ11W-1]|uniref:xanthine dehydrogenase small subunit n=1 Tax=Simiduia sp. 21SJ11W-1 TaxID=2909669 RepID=UPI0020A0A7AE|nr:xanthine dehydrogenase small subunit [Simiduia sp. 21SJ11W-1]UTA48280.1 xanthine dehydrogenase small subunit [Simiduia sp. 21SJ11W-1]
MRFWLNGHQTTVDDASADTTVLQYLRASRTSLGTKEGCASGDCGACTVLVSGSQGEGPGGARYQAVNSCLLPLGSVQERQLLTVEGLSCGAQLHPAQQALIDYHGSQCGFCTPGFAMSLAAAAQAASPEDTEARRAQVLDAISGNLCRCTGYKPIVEAGIAACGAGAELPYVAAAAKPAAEPLRGFFQPETETELRELLAAHPEARIIAGGTDLMLEATQAYQSLAPLIDVSRIPSLTRIDSAGDTLCIGAGSTYSAQEQALADIAPEYVAFLARLGSRQIRNRATLGGNICNASPIADTPPWLLVQEAELIIGKPEGGFRYERLEDFYLDYKKTTLRAGEYLADVRLSRARLACAAKLYKVSKRYEDDISAVCGAFLINPNNQLRIAFGGMAATPKRARLTEAFINKQPWQTAENWEAVVAQAGEYLAQDFTPLTDVRASKDYRLQLAHNLLRKACRAWALGADAEAGVYA